MEQRRLASFLPDIKDLYTITGDGEVYSDNVGKMKSRNKAGTEYQIINFMKKRWDKSVLSLASSRNDGVSANSKSFRNGSKS